MSERKLIRVDSETRPVLSVVIHTEEEFDWNKPHDRQATGVKHMRHIDRAQNVFDSFGIVPNYVVDYPIASQEEAFGPLKAYTDSGRALIGAHLHPWVSPPHDEALNARNSYPGNLPRELEYEKLRILTEQIKSSFGTSPLTYLAGRYGFGPNTGEILEELGYEVDISVAASIDYSADGGPDYSSYTSDPFWFGNQRRLLSLPGSGGYVGTLRAGGTPLYRRLMHPWLRKAKISGAVARLRLLERIRLSPEDYSEPEMRRLTKSLLADGVRIFVFSFHSPSVMPGGTPYVNSDADLERFLEKCRRYFDFFMRELGGTTMTPLEIKDWLEQH
ncbi:polysaccharide deacetylase family protein [Methylomonas sp. BW4-1]|uniref:polysaccharide deacetylase family protein n=1 Tax=Methylomonas sp. BW4-1 TaxID=3376685 RepID=UPI004042053C